MQIRLYKIDRSTEEVLPQPPLIGEHRKSHEMGAMSASGPSGPFATLLSLLGESPTWIGTGLIAACDPLRTSREPEYNRS
jgi:hypothetical protein